MPLGAGDDKNKKKFLFGNIDAEILENAIVHYDDQVRLDSLGLICDNPKTCEQVLPIEFELIKKFLEFNSDVLSPSFRQAVIASMKKVKKIKEEVNLKKMIFIEPYLSYL